MRLRNRMSGSFPVEDELHPDPTTGLGCQGDSRYLRVCSADVSPSRTRSVTEAERDQNSAARDLDKLKLHSPSDNRRRSLKRLNRYVSIVRVQHPINLRPARVHQCR